MLARVYSCTVIGLEGVVVEVEVDIGGGLPGVTIVGLPDAAVQDSCERHVPGVLPIAALARERGFKRLFVPSIDAAEAALIPDVEVYPVESLADLYLHLSGQVPIPVQPRGAARGPAGGRADRFRPHQGSGARQARPGGRRSRRRVHLGELYVWGEVWRSWRG